jgi:hypothetical protein
MVVEMCSQSLAFESTCRLALVVLVAFSALRRSPGSKISAVMTVAPGLLVSGAEQWGEFEIFTALEQQDLYLMQNVLWAAVFDRPTMWCSVHLMRLFGISAHRLAQRCACVAECEGSISAAVYAEARPHGNKGRSPVNKTVDDILRNLVRIFERSTVTSPIRNKIIVPSDCKLSGLSGLVHTIASWVT